jgi:hypothetical protein
VSRKAFFKLFWQNVPAELMPWPFPESLTPDKRSKKKKLFKNMGVGHGKRRGIESPVVFTLITKVQNEKVLPHYHGLSAGRLRGLSP